MSFLRGQRPYRLCHAPLSLPSLGFWSAERRPGRLHPISMKIWGQNELISPSIFSNLFGELIQRSPERGHDQKLSRADAPASAINCLLRWCSQGRQRTTWLLVAIDVTFGTVFCIVPLNLNEWLLLDLPVCSLTSFSSWWAGVHGPAL